MSLRIIRSADTQTQPWKNGLGTTREIARFPRASTSDDFVWRVSVAEVNSAAPFSLFPGIDRSIALLEGDGFTMTLDGDRQHALTTPYVPFAFAGEARVDVVMAGGATRDFNLMVRRASAQGTVTVYDTAGSHVAPEDAVLLYVARGAAHTTDGELQAGDAWLPDTAPFHLAPGALALLVRVHLHA
jgi:environmental stress-induced protein Ves